MPGRKCSGVVRTRLAHPAQGVTCSYASTTPSPLRRAKGDVAFWKSSASAALKSVVCCDLLRGGSNSTRSSCARSDMFVRLDNPKSLKTREGGRGVLEVIRFSSSEERRVLRSAQGWFELDSLILRKE